MVSLIIEQGIEDTLSGQGKPSTMVSRSICALYFLDEGPVHRTGIDLSVVAIGREFPFPNLSFSVKVKEGYSRST